MNLQPPLQLPDHLAFACERVRSAAQAAAAQTVDTLGLAALACTQVLQRDALLGAQYELNRKQALFGAAFNEALDTEVARQAGLLSPTPAPGGAGLTPEQLVASWESLSLVDDHEVELHISADRFALAIAHSCEWELREFDAYMATLMGLEAADHARNPLRAEVVAHAMMRAIDAMSGRPEVRRVLATEVGRALALAMRSTYGQIVAELRQLGVRPVGLSLRPNPNRTYSQPGALACGPGELGTAPGGLAGGPDSTAGRPGAHGNGHTSPMGPTGSGAGTGAGQAQSQTSAPAGLGNTAPSGPNHGLGQVQADMMRLIRQLASAVANAAQSDSWATSAPAGSGSAQQSPEGLPLVAPNLIATHREALRQQASSALDHLVIDLVAGLFDQILSDAKVPPQFARQIARLQLPVLRAALGDSRFFASARHPVRQLVNRIASLGAAMADEHSAAGTALLERVAALVQAVVEGDFEDVALYQRQLQALDAFVAEQAHTELASLGAADQVLAAKEDELLSQQHFAQQLDQALQPLPVPDYLRQFIARVWSRAIHRTERKEGPKSPLSQRLRQTGTALVMSVQPKGAPAQRQQFLRQLPQLMKDLTLGLDHARCPEAERRAFYGQLLPNHAEALKGAPLSTLEHNLLLRQVSDALATPVLAAHAVPASTSAARQALQALAQDQHLSPAEAQAVGLVPESAVDWQVALDINLDDSAPVGSANRPLQAVDIQIDGLPAAEAPEPTRGPGLAEHLRLGQAYQMHLQAHLEARWHTVRLAHISPGRSFYVFTHGQKHRRTVSLTHRMLLRLCDSGRLRALEAAYLLERATARTRRQLAELGRTSSA